MIDGLSVQIINHCISTCKQLLLHCFKLTTLLIHVRKVAGNSRFLQIQLGATKCMKSIANLKVLRMDLLSWISNDGLLKSYRRVFQIVWLHMKLNLRPSENFVRTLFKEMNKSYGHSLVNIQESFDIKEFKNRIYHARTKCGGRIGHSILIDHVCPSDGLIRDDITTVLNFRARN